jgi:hypothetical protein
MSDNGKIVSVPIPAGPKPLVTVSPTPAPPIGANTVKVSATPIPVNAKPVKIENTIMAAQRSPVRVENSPAAVMGTRETIAKTMPIIRPGPPAPAAMAPIKLGGAPIVTVMSPKIVDSTARVPGVSGGGGDQTPFPAGIPTSGAIGAGQRVTILEKKAVPVPAVDGAVDAKK